MESETETPSGLRRLSFDRPAWPFNPQRVPFFYGWVIVLAATFGVLCSAPGQTIGVSVFTDNLMVATGLSRVQISLTYLVGTLGGALFLPRAGRIYDRLGARTMTVVTAIAFGSTLLLLSQIDVAIAALRYVLSADLFALPVSFAVMGLSFFALRFLGQGVLTIAARNMMVKWFEARRGFANGVMGIMSSFGFSGAPVLFDVLIDEWGWQAAWQILGITIIVGLTVVAGVFFRDSPEECGMQADGACTPNRSGQRATGRDHTPAQARATLSFWLIMLPMMLSSIYGTAMPFHVVSIFAEAGLDRQLAIGIFLPAAAIAVVANFVGGWLADRSTLRWHLVLYLVGIILSNIGVLNLHLPWGRYGIIVGSGLMGGMMRLLSTLTWPRYFGRRHLGAVSGFAMSLGVSASAVGPSLFGLSLQAFDSYHPACWVTISLSAILLILSPWAREPD
ncbi:MAG TPA: MFS transporter [Candidatus Latescibacteria bacterium]|jgi:MFS family permease|nr:MFS transporter [Gemmatimonadaceae bacterium]MDP6015157.1 MFS transporter [Candidatus Latescibacterota bacterium]HJP33041.1 MFS transporter [Candidatus Latescibacterota bacterium]